MPLAAGSQLGPYEIVELVGAGGMGEVYKARDTRLDRIVAVKVSKQQFEERFEREARAVAALSHPRICTLYDVGPNYLVMEFVEGRPLKGPLPVPQILRYASQICDPLQAAHAKSIIHRDLKPGNILVSGEDLKLLDFGLAKVQTHAGPTDETEAMPITGEAQFVGTLQYTSPEQLAGTRRTRAAICSPSASSSTRWPPAEEPSRAIPPWPSAPPSCTRNPRPLTTSSRICRRNSSGLLPAA
jgi:serine/threonine protein kinase